MKINAKTGPLAWLVYAIVRTAMATLQVFPIRWNYRLADALAKGWVLIMPRHRERCLDNMRKCDMNQRPAAELESLADDCLAHWTRFVMDLVHSRRVVTPISWPRYISPENFDDVLKLMLHGRGVILVTGHYGHFEMSGHLLASLGFDVTAIMRPLDNVYLNRYLTQSLRGGHGMRLLDKKGAMQHSRGILEAGGALAFIADQNAGRKGVFVDFFGRKASTYKSIGLLAMATNTPIVVGYARRDKSRFHFTVGMQQIIYPEQWQDQDQPLRYITEAYTKAIENFVRDDPAQYLWFHRRWKTRPKEEREAEAPAERKLVASSA